MSHSPEEVQKHIKVYLGVFAALGVLTVITVAISYVHLSIVPAVILALVVASTKAGLVAWNFMHLSSEKKIIFWILYITAIFFLFLMIIPLLTVSTEFTTH